MHTLSNSEIDQIEFSLTHKLPSLYRDLLTKIGYTAPRSEIEIYHPLEIASLYESYFDDESHLFNVYFPFGCQNRTQEIWIIDAVSERAASIWHETVPEDWVDEEWLAYNQWAKANLESAHLSLLR